MFELDNPTQILLALVLVVPGFVWTRVEQRFIVRKKIEWSERLLGYLVYTCLNYAFWYITLLPGLVARFVRGEVVALDILSLTLIFLIGPLIGGTVTGWMAKSDTIGFVLSCLRLPATVDPHHPSGWDVAFGSPKSRAVRVTTKSGDVIDGLMGTKSCASADSEERDLYLEATFQQEAGLIRITPNSLGVWISHEELKIVEFFQLKGFSDERQSKRSLARRITSALSAGIAAYNGDSDGAACESLPRSWTERSPECGPSSGRSSYHQSDIHQPFPRPEA